MINNKDKYNKVINNCKNKENIINNSFNYPNVRNNNPINNDNYYSGKKPNINNNSINNNLANSLNFNYKSYISCLYFKYFIQFIYSIIFKFIIIHSRS